MKLHVGYPHFGSVVVFLVCFILSAVSGIALENSQLQWELSAGPEYIGGPMYPKDSSGTVRTEYWVFWKISTWREKDTNRTSLPITVPDLIPTAPNQIKIAASFWAPYSFPTFINTFTLNEKGSNYTLFNKTLIGVGGLKISSELRNDSNVFNTSTEKVFYVSLDLSHPIRNVTEILYPTIYQEHIVLRTDFYHVIINQPVLAESDGEESNLTFTISSLTYNNHGELTGIVVTGTSTYHRDWIYDPELSIVLTPTSSSGDSDSSDNSDLLGLLALIALIFIPIGLILVSVGVMTWLMILRKRRLLQSRGDTVNF